MLKSVFRKQPKFYTWTNSDGTPGGDVSRFAEIDPAAVVERFSIVLSGSKLGPDAHVRAGDMIDGDRVIRFGPDRPFTQRAEAKTSRNL